MYTLPDQANLSIPSEIREQYQRDEFGRVLFFTTPPVSAGQGATGLPTGHSVRYLAAKARRAQQLAQKRQERDLQLQADERLAKKARLEADERAGEDIEALKKRAFSVFETQLADGVDGDLGDRGLTRLSAAQKAAAEQMQAMALNDARRDEVRRIRLEGDVFADDWDNRVT